MPLTYLTLTKDEMDLRIAQALRAREEEHFHYELNRQNYENLLASPELAALPAEWPDELARFKKMTRDELAAAVSDNAQFNMAVNLQLRDKLKHLSRCESLEAARVEKYHAQLKDKLPKQKAELDALLLKEKTTREAKV